MFLVFEGLDGAGKSTLIGKAQQYLMQHGKNVLLTREPGGTALCDELRKILLRTGAEVPVPKCELLLYESIRAQHVEKVIRPALEKKTWVLCDRFTASTYAFQSAGRNLNVEDIHWLNKFATNGLEPDLNILLDISTNESLRRLSSRAKATGQDQDRFELEKLDFHERVRQGYLSLAKSQKNWLVLDAAKDASTLFTNLLSELRSRGWDS